LKITYRRPNKIKLTAMLFTAMCRKNEGNIDFVFSKRKALDKPRIKVKGIELRSK